MRNLMRASLVLPLLLACGPRRLPEPPPIPTAPSTAAPVPPVPPAPVVLRPADGSPVVARVQGTGITEAELRSVAEKKAPANGKSLSAAERQEVLDELVAERLLYLDALQKGYDKDPKVQKVMINSLLREEVYGQIRNSDFTDEMLQRYYDDHRSDFVVPEKVQIRTLLITKSEDRSDAEARKLVEDLYRQISKDPNRMKDLAAAHSEDPYRRRGGDVGFVSKEGKPGLEPLILSTAWALPDHQVSKPLSLPGGYALVLVVARREEVARTFQQMKGSVLRAAKNEQMGALYEAKKAALLTGAPVEVDATVLQGVEVQYRPSFSTPSQEWLDQIEEEERDLTP